MSDSGVATVGRRGFCKAAAAAAAGLVLASECALTSCSPENKQESTEQLETGEWRFGGCYFSCGGRCINKVYVVDGVPVKQTTDDTHEDSFDHPQQRGCLKGRLMRRWVLADDRLRFPMKRKNWQPGGVDYHPELRGQDEWERISWDEALDITAAELTRIKESYGNEAFLTTGLVNYQVYGFVSGSMLNVFGGCSSLWGQQSSGAAEHPTRTMVGGHMAADRYSILQSKLIVLWGMNPSWSEPGNTAWFYAEAKRRGAKIIMVDPQYTASCQALADEWVCVRPGTDAALLCGIAHHLITNNLHNQEFLDKYCLGFDADHMPEGHESDENFKDYILGAYDGIPKTVEWASEICGTPVDVIKSLAEQMGTVRPMALKTALAPTRTYNGLNYLQLFYAVGWMCGNLGTPGNEVSLVKSTASCYFGGPGLVNLGKDVIKAPANPVCSQPRGGGLLAAGKYDPEQFYGVAYAELYDAIMNGEVTDFVHGKRKVNFKAYIADCPTNSLNQLIGAQSGYEAFRAEGKLEFVLSADLFMSTDAMYADIVLPACSTWEFGNEQLLGCNREALIFGTKVMDPLYEARPEWDWHLDLLKRLGCNPEDYSPMSYEASQKTRLANTTVVLEGENPTMETEFLAEVTQEDIDEFGLACEPHEGRIPFKELEKTGTYQVPRSEGDDYAFVPFAAYIADPEANPLPTASGKMEIFCQSLHDSIAVYNTTPLDALPKYVPAVEGYEDSFADWESKEKGEFPLQMITIHHIARAHSTYANNRVINELHPDNMLMNPIDAKNSGVEDGDTCLISSAHGKILRRVTVTERIMPGVLSLGQGNWTDIDEETGIDFGGNVNTLEGAHLVGDGFSPYNTLLVKVEKWQGEPLVAPYLQPTRQFDDEGGKKW